MESFLYSPLPINQLAIYNCHNRTHRRRRNSRPHNRRRVHAPVLAIPFFLAGPGSLPCLLSSSSFESSSIALSPLVSS